jgi:hypothetical protein
MEYPLTRLFATLLATPEDWLRDHGMQRVSGPR